MSQSLVLVVPTLQTDPCHFIVEIDESSLCRFYTWVAADMPGVILLLLLLGTDWYFDTSCGTSPFARPMCSTEVVCQSLVYKHCIQQKMDRPELWDADPTACPIEPSSSPMFPGRDEPASVLLSASPIHVFMSMQC
jgi:hypothetical protein